jgi:hypothetical protein
VSQSIQRLRFKVMRMRSQELRKQPGDKHRYFDGSIARQSDCNWFDLRLANPLLSYYALFLRTYFTCCVSWMFRFQMLFWSALRTLYIKRAALNDIYELPLQVGD